MSWIDIFLNEGDPRKIYGADAETALRKMPQLRHLPWIIKPYRRAGLSWTTVLGFLVIDIVRSVAYRKGFKDGGSYPWPD
jgi:hypothetical protein